MICESFLLSVSDFVIYTSKNGSANVHDVIDNKIFEHKISTEIAFWGWVFAITKGKNAPSARIIGFFH